MKSKQLLGSLAAGALVLLGFVVFTSSKRPAPEANPAAEVALEAATAGEAPLVSRTAPAAAGVQQAASGQAPEHLLAERRVPAAVDPVREPHFAAFDNWLVRFEQADEAGKAMLENEGKALAQARLFAYADLIPTDPQRAIELAVPFVSRMGLPESIRELLETPVNARGDFTVMATVPFGSKGSVPSLFRTATIQGEEYQAFTYGEGEQYLTRKDVPLNGYSVPLTAATKPPVNPLTRANKLLALDPRPARQLARAEVNALKAKNADVICSVSGDSWTAKQEETAAEIAGQVLTFCGPAHLRLIENQAIAASGMLTPGGGKDTGGGLAKSSYTEGRKRMLLMRPYWTNQPVAMTTNSAITHFINFSNYMWQMSYGKLTFAALGKGSDITPEMIIPGDVDSYIAGLGNATNDAWRVVREVAVANHGYDLGNYDFVYYVTTDQPSASYCGLGFVGGVGFHLANSCFDAAVSSHEFGHNLGLNHANFWSTSMRSVVGPGVDDEYGDSNDPMGGGGNPNQFNARYKNYLGWITNADIATIPSTGSNRYRLYAFDLDYGVGLRGLRFPYSGSQNYWLQFRQRKTTSASIMNGVQLMWTGNGNQSSHVLDVRLKGSSSDNALVIGRTYSDTNLNFHVTPIGKGNTYPESIDVVAVTGPQPGNQPPVAFLSASTLNPPPEQPVTFTATATDPNGDTLAYYWEFGDNANNYSEDNQPTQTHTFGSAGEYAVRCVVSDMRGGVAHHTLIVRVGNPNVFRISGHVTDERSQPLAGARVTAGSRTVFTDSDGSYTIPGLNAGNYTVSAFEPVRGAFEFVHPQWNNPVTVGPNAEHVDFIVGTNAPPISLVATGALWRYLDKGTDQGTAWTAPLFSDLTWSNGPSPLGYGDSDEATRIEDNATPGYNAPDQNRYITYYFRRAFNVTTPGALTNVVLNVQRDDGIIVYLNGTEIFRDNMPGTGVNYLTVASDSASDDGDEWLITNVPPALLVAGNNVISAEVHQESAASSDVSFNLTLTAENIINTPRATIVYIESPANNSTFTSPTNITISAHAFNAPNSVTNVDIFDGATKLASIVTAPYTTVLNSPTDGLHVLRAISTDSTGLRRTSAPVNITVSAPVALPVVMSFVQTGSVWRYFSTNAAAALGWQNAGFNDSSWASGPARIGFGGANLATTINGGPSASRFVTAYFRQAFVANDPASVTNLQVIYARDDGAVIYLNGVELARNNITNGIAPFYSMLATNASDNGGNYFTAGVPPELLKPGTNILAAEIHQGSLTSGDLVFDLGLTGFATTNRARGCWLVAPSQGTNIPAFSDVDLEAEVVAGGGLSITTVEFYADGVRVAAAFGAPFQATWIHPIGGAHVLHAVARDSTGASITSAPVNITVSAVPGGQALISFGDVWKYLDNGVDAGTAWRASAFNDNQWMMGAAQLGYGDGDETTAVSFGTNANFKYVTTYFRKKFVVSNPGEFSGLLLSLIRDDGVVVYLNGTEVFRDNLTVSPVSYNSLADTAIGGADENTPIEVTLATVGLVAGTNTLAVEVHQDSITSSDLSFDLSLSGLRATNTTQGVYITSPAQGTHYNTPAVVELSANAVSSAGAITLVEYFAGNTKIAEGAVYPYGTSWGTSAAGTHVLTAVATYGAGLRMTSPPVSIVVGPAPAPIAPVFTQYINWGSQWKYWDSASAVGNGWQSLAFDDAAWPVGNARLGWGIDGESTLLTEGRVTHYFRRAFVVNNGSALDSLTFNVVRDDGVVVYMNGVEVFRTNMPAGPIDSGTLASSTVNTPDETIPVVYTLSTSTLGPLHGTNVIAVELHQSSATSSDGGFDLSLYGEGTTEPRIYVAAPLNGSTHVTGVPMALEAQAQAGTGRSLSAVEFIANGTNIAQTSVAPYRTIWSAPPAGVYSIVARATDNLGNSLTSAPVLINVGHPTISMVLIPSNSVWKFLDNGSNQGTNWAQTNFNDVTWPSGAAELGYGDLPDGRPETTVICCSNAAVKNITYYFRRQFVVPPDTFITNLTFRLVRDDGALVWLNGREMYRSNMPTTAITYQTVASAAVNGSAEGTYFTTVLGTTNVFPGTNLVAVEVHQNANNSSDVSFNLQVEGNGYVLSTAAPGLVATESGGQFRIAWPTSATGYQLHWSQQVGPGASWQPVGGMPAVSNGFNVLIIPTTNPSAFYRLQK